MLVGVARGRVIIRGELAAEQQPGKLRIVDEDVAVALHLLDTVVAAHFPGVHGVLLHPFKQGVEALDDGHAGVLAVIAVIRRQIVRRNLLKQIRLAPAAVDVQQHACQVALDIVGDLDAVVLRAVPQDGLAVKGLRGAVGIDTQHVAHGIVAARGVHAGILGAQVVQVAAAILLHEACPALRPDVLAAHAAAGRVAVEQEQAVFALRGIRARPVGRQGLIGDGIGHGVRHQGLQRAVKRTVHALKRAVRGAAGQLQQRFCAVGVILLRLCAQGRAGLMARAGVIRHGVGGHGRQRRERQRQHDGQRQKHGKDPSFHDVPPFVFWLLSSYHAGDEYATRICIRPARRIAVALHGQTCYNHGIET